MSSASTRKLTRIQSTFLKMFAAAFVALLPRATAASQASPIRIDAIREWITAHHPHVYDDTTVNTVVIVLDSKGKYLRSIAEHFDPTEVSAMDFRFARVEELIAAREGRRQVDTLLSYSCFGRSTLPAGRRPVCVLDGARIDSFDDLQKLAINKIETMTGAPATAHYGAGAVNGAVIASSVPSLMERFRGLGLTAENMESMQTNRVRGGVVGPRPLDIMLVFLKF